MAIKLRTETGEINDSLQKSIDSHWRHDAAVAHALVMALHAAENYGTPSDKDAVTEIRKHAERTLRDQFGIEDSQP